MAEGMRTLNPPCKEEISFINSFISDYDDVESAVNDYTIKKRNKNSILSRFVNEVELT